LVTFVTCLLTVTLHIVEVHLTCLINITYLLTYLQSRPQVAQSLPFSPSPHASATNVKPVGSHYL